MKQTTTNLLTPFFLSDADGNVKSVSPAAPEVLGKNFAYRDWYKGAISTGKPYVSEVYKRANGPKINVVAMATPIMGDNQKIAGILVFQVSLDHFLDLTQKIPIGANGFVSVVDKNGQIVASPEYLTQDMIINQDNISVVKDVLSGKTGVSQIYDSKQNTAFLVAYQPSLYHWGILVEQPISNAFAEIRFVREIVIGVFVGILLINVIRIRMVKKIIKSCP